MSMIIRVYQFQNRFQIILRLESCLKHNEAILNSLLVLLRCALGLDVGKGKTIRSYSTFTIQ